MSTTFGQSTYQEIADTCVSDCNEWDLLANLPTETIQQFILRACQDICNQATVVEERKLRLLTNVDVYDFADTTTPVTGTGTVSGTNLALTGSLVAGTGTITVGSRTVTGVGTLFKTEVVVGNALVVGTQVMEVLSIESNTSLTLLTVPVNTVTAEAYTVSSTKFTREVVSGSVLVSNSITMTVDSVTDPYNIVLKTPLATTLGANTFTIDTKVTELPTRFSDIDRIVYLLNGASFAVKIVDYDYIADLSVADRVAFYPSFVPYAYYSIPYVAAVDGRLASKRVLRVYPSPIDNREVTLHAFIKINARYYASQALTSYVPLDQRFEPAIIAYTKYKMYEWMKKFDLAGAQLNMYQSLLQQIATGNVARHTMTIDPS